jgi:hypothetical protein
MKACDRLLHKQDPMASGSEPTVCKNVFQPMKKLRFTSFNTSPSMRGWMSDDDLNATAHAQGQTEASVLFPTRKV